MGITGLIPFLEKASSKINLKEIAGCTVAIDTYCWLHKGAIACADKLSRGEDTDMHVKYCLKYVNLLLSYKLKPILVFDGQHLPAKAQTENRRREIRKNSKKRAAELLRMGKTEEARSQMRRCIDITHEMALQLIKKCRQMNVDCIVAPYEADAQIAFFSKHNIVQYIITEDSDLTLFGCKKIIFKLDLVGNGLLVDSDKFHLAMGCRLEKFTMDKFRYMCILSGCDYLDSLPGIGLAKACKFILMTEETDMRKALTKIPAYLNMRNLIVCDDYIEGFLKADATFKHMFVFDPLKREMVRLNELSEFNTNIEYCSNAGHQLDNDIAFELALGNLHPFTLKRLDNWNPDIHFAELKNQGISKQVKSIWIGNINANDLKHKTNNIGCALKFKKITLKSYPQTSDPEKGSLESEVVSLYTSASNDSIRKRPRTRCDSSDSDDSIENTPKNRMISPETPVKNTHNPFASPTSSKFSLESSKNSSLLKIISPSKKELFNNSDNNSTSNTIKIKQIVRSRLFSSNLVLSKINVDNIKEKDEQLETVNSNSEDIIEEIKELHEQKQTETSLYISSPEMTENLKIKIQNSPDSFNKFEDNEVNVQNNESPNQIQITSAFDVDNYKHSSPIKISKNKTKPHIGLVKPKQKQKQIVPDKNQSRLSMFGFKKRSTLNHT